MGFFDKLPSVHKEAMVMAAESPGRYGGRYVGRRYNQATREDEYEILDDDDPELYRNDKALDILAQVTPTKVYGIGHARYWITADGDVYW